MSSTTYDLKINYLVKLNEIGETPLTQAVFAGEHRRVISLLSGLSSDEQQQVLCCRNRLGQTPLDIWLKCLGDREPLRRLLLSYRAPYSGSSQLPLSPEQKQALATVRSRHFDRPAVYSPHTAYVSLSCTLDCLSPPKEEPARSIFLEARATFNKTIDYQLESSAKIAERILKGETVVIPTGWIGHVTAIVFSGHRVLFCNRGIGSGSSPGVSLFTMTSPPSHAQLTAVIAKLRRRNDQKFFCTGMKRELNLKPAQLAPFQQKFFLQARQKRDNCTIASPKSALLALLSLSCRTLEEFALAKQMYKEITSYDRRSLAKA